MTDRTKTDEELEAEKLAQTGDVPDDAPPRPSAPPRASLAPRAAGSVRPLTPSVGVPRASLTPAVGVPRARGVVPRAAGPGAARPPAPPPPPRLPTPAAGVARPPLPVPRPPTLPRQPAPPRLPPVAARPAPVASEPPEEIDDIDLLADEAELIESIEPLALSSMAPSGPELVSLAHAASALAPAPLPSFSEPPAARESAPPAAASVPPAPSTPSIADFFADLPDDDASSGSALDDAPTQMVDAASLAPSESFEATELRDASELLAPPDALEAAAGAPSEAPMEIEVDDAFGLDFEDGNVVDDLPEEPPRVSEPARAASLAPEIEAPPALDFELSEEIEVEADLSAPEDLAPDLDESEELAPQSVRPASLAPEPVATPSVRPASLAPEPVATPSVRPASLAPEPVAPPSVRPASLAPEPVATPSVRPASLAPEPVAPPSVRPASLAPEPVAPPSVRPASLAPEPEARDDSASPELLAAEVSADDFALDLEMEELESAAPVAVEDRPSDEAVEAPTTIEALEAELFADIPQVDLGAALPPEAGFADLALADDELDAMFRDLELADEPGGSDEAPAPPVVTPAAMPPEAEVDDFVGFYEALAETSDEEAAGPLLEADDDDDDEEMLLIDGEEEEVLLEAEVPADRGAMLAATVTSRKREQQASDALYALEPKDEAQARVDLLADEAGQDDSYLRAAEGLALVAETVDGVFADPARARNFAERAYALAPEVVSATRLLRRLDIAEGRDADAYQRVLEELRTPLAPIERAALQRLAGELAARVKPGDAAAHWDELAGDEGVAGALAALFAGAQRRDPDAIAAALARWSDHTGGELAASLSVARARLVESRGNDDALEAIRDAVRRDPSDAGAWIAMARIALSHVRPEVAAEALTGLSRVGGGGSLAVAAEALSAAIRAVVGQTVPPTVLEDHGVSAWLMARAQEEAGVDSAPQIAAAVAAADEATLPGWRRREGALEDSETGWFYALRSAVARRDAAEVARCSAGVLGGSGAAVSALLAGADAASEAERVALDEGNPLAALLAAAAGQPRVSSRADDPYVVIESAERMRRGGEGRVEEALGALTEVALQGEQPAAASFAARAVASLTGDPAQVVEMLRVEASRSRDARRAAASRLVASALGAAYGVADGAEGIAEAAEALPGDLAVAELAALFALRGELDPELGAELLDKASAAGDDRAHHTAAVRSALRRAAVDPDSATEAVWRAWMRCPKDAALGTLVLRSPAQPAERVAAVLRTQIDSAHAEGAQGAPAAIAEGLLLAAVLEQAGRYAEAAQAVARARTLDLEDPSLVIAEERLWLKAGMFAEVAERAFEQLRAAREDEERVAAYERLAELDRSYRGDIASSVLSFQAILEVAPGHVASQRTLERYLIEQGRSEELQEIYQRMVDHLSDPEDALAYAHVAARIAANLGDADLSAAGPILRGVFARGLADRRLAVSLDAEARRSADPALFAEAQLRGAQFAGNEQERATCFVRAGEGFLAAGLRERARESFEHALAVDPGHLVALQHAAAERAEAGDLRAAAEACESLGRRLKTPTHGAVFLCRAAEHLRGSDGPRALALAQEALARDPANVVAWSLASELAREQGDARAEIELVAMRADAPPSGERGDALTLHLRAAELSLSLGDRERARNELRRVVELDPSRIEALRTLAQLTWEDSDWAAAADASIRLAKLSQDPPERGEMLFRLGEIYDLRLPDTKRAEAAYRRAIQVVPDEVRAHERLVTLYEREGDEAKEFEVLQALTARTMPGPERIARLLRVAELAERAMSDVGRAELAFEGARREAPMDVEVLRRYADFLERSASSEARKVLLERAGAEARRGVDLAPRESPAYDMLIEVRRLRRDDGGARSIASVAMSLGARSELIDTYGSLTPEHPLGARAMTPGAVELLAPPSVPSNLRTLLSQAQDLLAASAPFDASAEGAEALGARPHPVRGLVEEWSKLLGVSSVELYITGSVDETVRPIGGGAHALLVPATVSPSLGLRFAVARAMLIDALGLGLVTRVPPRDLALHVAALLRQFEPMHRPPNVDLPALDEHARAMTRVFPRARHAELSPVAFQVIERGPIDASALLSGTWELGNRLALLATEDMSAAVSLLAPDDGATPAKLTSTSALGRLLRVSTSDRFAEARRVAERGEAG